MTVPDAVAELIADAPLSAHLATAVDDRPHVAPVWYGYRDGRLYCLTGGKKLANLRRNPRVAVSIERAVDGAVDWQVTLLGRATVVDDPDRMEWASGWIYEAYEGGDGAATAADDPATAADEPATAADDPAASADDPDPAAGAEPAEEGHETTDGSAAEAADAAADEDAAADADGAADEDGAADADGAADEETGALVEIAIRSAAWAVY